MILQALADYYEALINKGILPCPGWAEGKVSWALDIDGDGTLLSVQPLKKEVTSGKKNMMVSRKMALPAPVKRSRNASKVSNFLWDNAEHLLGVGGKESAARAKESFDSAKQLHLKLLGHSQNEAAKAICAFFESWDISGIETHPALSGCMEDLLKGENLTFLFREKFASDISEVKKAWQEYYDEDEAGDMMPCLVTGKPAVPAKIHPFIKGVKDAQSSGAAMVSFNADAFCSYGREQNLNAPVGKYAAFAYTSALNYLVSARKEDGTPAFSRHVGDMTVVYWAENGETSYQDALSALLDGTDDDHLSNDVLGKLMEGLATGNPIRWNDLPLNPANRFYIIGLSPNAARISVRFFLQSEFGDIIRHFKEHYDRLCVGRPAYDNREQVPLWALLKETVNQNSKDKTPHPQMAGDTLRAILTGARYPATLYQQTLLRIRAEGEITRERAAAIKAYLLRNLESKKGKEALTVELNEQTTYLPYVLGRLFSVLEAIQEKANPGINTTIKDKYFSSASATPAMVFPTLMNLTQKHLKKIDGVYYEKRLGTLVSMITESYPKHMGLHDQGIFQLGYYHQTQKRYETKNTNKMNAEENKNV